MLITKLKSKIHKVKVTNTQLQYEGSCGISVDLLHAAGIQPHEQIHIYNINNGERFTTYAIISPPGIISVRGAAARKVAIGDILTICSYCQVPEENNHQPIVVYVDDENGQSLNDTTNMQDYKIVCEDSQGVSYNIVVSAKTEDEAKENFYNTYEDEMYRIIDASLL